MAYKARTATFTNKQGTKEEVTNTILHLSDGGMNANNNNNNHRRQRQRVASEDGLLPSDNARLAYAVMSQSSPRRPPEEEFWPEICQGVTNPTNVIVLPPPGAPGETPPPIYLMRRDGALQAYALTAKKSISLDHHERDWGCVMFAVIYNREGNIFEAPTEEQAKYVAIKKLKKSVVQKYMRKGGEENPYKEIARMQELGDDIHVLACVEALEDEEYLYIVTPKACAEGTLKDAIPWLDDTPMDPARARDLFIQILRILAYLESKGICHRDLSPDNFIFLTPQRLVAFDLALSVRVPVNENGQRTLITPLGNFGTRAFMAPEIFLNRVFDGLSSDLWTAAIILYNMLTNQILYCLPHPSDISFRYFILARGLSSTPINERTVEILMDTFNSHEAAQRRHQHQLLAQSMAHLNLNHQAIELLEHMFPIDPSERWTLAEVMESAYVRSEQDG